MFRLSCLFSERVHAHSILIVYNYYIDYCIPTAYCMKVIPVLYGPLVLRTSTIVSIELPLRYSNEKTLAKVVMPQSKLHKIFREKH